MRNIVLIDFRYDEEHTACIGNVSEDENTIIVAFYPRAVGIRNAGIEVYDEDFNKLYAEYYSYALDMGFFEIPARFFPTKITSLYFKYVDESWSSQYYRIDFIAGLKSYQYNMIMVKDANNIFRAYFRRSMSDEDMINWIEGTEVEIENTQQQVQSVSDVVSQVASVNEALIESLTTNLTKYALRPRITKKADGWEWTDFVTNPDSSVTYTPCFSSNSTDKLRSYINIEDVKIKYLTEQLTVPSDYSKIAESDTSYLTVNGKQIYYKSLDDLTSGFTTINPKELDKTITDHVVDMYKCRKLSAVGNVDWNIEIYQSVTSTTEGEETVLKKSVGINLNDTCKLGYDSSTNTLQAIITNTTDNKPRGIKMSNEGVYYTQDGVNWVLIGTYQGDTVKMIDHAPTVDDISGEDCVLVQYDPEATPVVTTETRQIISASNVFVEVEYIPPEPITISPTTASAVLGGTVQFTCNYADATWSVNSSISTISATGLLEVGATETASELTVTVTSATAPQPNTATAVVTIGNHERVQRNNFEARLTELWRQYYGEHASSTLTQLHYGAYLNEASYVEVYWGTNPSVNNSFLTLAYDSNGKILQPTGSQGQYYSRFNHSGQSNMGYNTAAIGATLQITLDIYD